MSWEKDIADTHAAIDKLINENDALRAKLAACEQQLKRWTYWTPDGTIEHWLREREQQLAAAQATIAGYRNTVNIYTEQFTRLESRTARLRKALKGYKDSAERLVKAKSSYELGTLDNKMMQEYTGAYSLIITLAHLDIQALEVQQAIAERKETP